MKKTFKWLLALVAMVASINLMGATYTITFKTAANDGSTAITNSTQSSTVISEGTTYVSGFTSSCDKAYYNGKNGVKLGSGKGGGTLEFNVATDYQSNIKKITVVSAKYNTEDASITLYSGSTSLVSGKTPGTDFTHTFTSATKVSSIKLTSGTKRAYITSITLETEEADPTDPSLSVSPEEIDFGSVEQNATIPSGQEVEVTFANLTTNDVTASISGDFDISKSGGFTSGDKITVTPKSTATIGTINGTLTVKATTDDITKTVPVTMTVAAPEVGVSFEKATSAYTDWEFTNFASQQTHSDVKAHTGAYFGTTDSKASGSMVTKAKIAKPGTLQFFISKQSTNTSSSSWKVSVSSDKSEWTQVGEAIDATSMSKGTWTEVNIDLTAYTNVYVKLEYAGSTAVRCIDDVVFIAPLSYNVTLATSPENVGTVTAKVNNVEIGAQVEEGQTVTLTATPNDAHAYRFKEWQSDDVTITDNAFKMPGKAVSITAVFEQLYAVSIATAGDGEGTAKFKDTEATTIYVSEDDQIDIVATIGNASEFSGWTTSDENISVNDNSALETYAIAMVSGTITANFAALTCEGLAAPTLSEPTISYEDGVTLNWVTNSNAYGYAVEVTDLEDNVIQSGIVFTNSFTITEELGVNTQYKYSVSCIGDGSTYCENNPASEDNFTTADYPTIEVTYSENGNTEHKVNQKLFTEFNLPTTARKASKTFVGWSKNSDCTTAPEYKPGEEITLEESDVEENKITFYAVYATESEGDKYFEKVTTVPTDWCGKYLIVYETGKLAMDGSLETLDAVDNSQSVTISDSKIAWSQDMEDISFTIAYKTGSSTVYSLKSASGKYISGTTTSAKAANGLKQADTDADYEISFDGLVLQSKSSDQQMVLKYNKSDDQTRFRFYKSGQDAIAMYKYSATISYSDYTTTCKDKVATPVLTTGGTFAQEQSITITCETEGATIYYTTDGTTPNSGSEQYTGAISVSERGKTTITAIAIKADMENSDVASADYIINKPFASVSELIDYVTEKELTSLSDVTVTGVVSEIVTEYNPTYSNVSFNISDNGKTDGVQLQGYRTKGDKADVVAVGDKVTLKGNYKLFNSIHELDADNTITEYTAKDLSSVTVGGTAAKTEYISGETFDYAGLTATANYSNTGYSVDVTDDVTWANNLTDSKVTENTTVKVTAEYKSILSEAFDVPVTVSSKTLTKIELDKDYFEVYVGQALPKPTVTATYSEGDPADVSAVAEYDTENQYNKTIEGTYTITVAYTFGTTMSETYTVKVKDYANDAEHPYSVSEALTIITEVIGNTKSGKNIIVTGTVNAEVIASGKYGRYKITDGEKELTVFDGKAFSDGNGGYNSFNSSSYPKENDVVLVEGKVINYNETTPEFVTGESHLLSWTRPATLEIADVDNHEVGLPDLAEADLTITKNSTADVTFTSSDNESAVTVVDNKLHAVAAGSATITANIAATENENALNYTTASTTFKVTVIASQQRYSVTIDGNGADGGEAPEPIADQLEKAQVTLPVNTYTRTNHKFTGWVVTNNTTTAIIDQNEGTFVMPASAVTITAQWEAKPTFNNGIWVKVASVDDLTEDSYVIIAAKSYSKAIKTYESGNNHKAQDVSISGDILSYTTAPAIFQVKNYTKEAVIVGKAFLNIESEKYLYLPSNDNKLTENGTIENKSAFTFSIKDGVHALTNCNLTSRQIKYNNNSSCFACYTTGQDNIVVYKYIAGAYAITFDANGGDQSTVPSSIVTNEGKANIPTTIPTHETKGNVFAYWTDDAAGEGTHYTKGQENCEFSANTTLYAQWETLSAHHITYVSGGAAGEIPVDAEDYYKGDDVKLKSASKLSNPGHNFAGWQVSYNDGEKQIISVVDNQFTMPDYDVTATAQWALRTNDKWVRVTDENQLVAGDKYVLACNSKDAVNGDLNVNHFPSVNATFSDDDDKLFITAMTGQLALTLGGEIDAWTLAKDANNYLATSNNDLSWSQTETTWKIEITTQKNVNITSGESYPIKFNDGANPTRFKTYNGQTAIQLYRLIPDQKVNNEVDASTLPNQANVTVNEGGNLIIDATKTLGDLYVMAGGKVTIQEGKTLAVKNFVIKSEMGGGKSGQVIGVTENYFKINGDAFFDVTMDKCAEGSTIADQWHAFAVPFNVDAINGIYDLDDKKLTNEVNYAIMDYHGDVRAEGKYGWKKFRGIMTPGTFYLMTVDGERTTYRMKMASTFEVASKEIDVYEFAQISGETTDAGWNGIANSQLEYVMVAAPVQVLNPATYTYEPYAESSVNFTVGTPFFYQASATGTIDLTAPNAGANYAPRMTAEAKNIAVTFANESYTDRLYISATDEATDEYQIGRDLVKMTMTNTPAVPQIFAQAYGTKLCMIDAPMAYDQASYALSLYAPAAGTYTISAAQVEGYEIYLTQNGNAIWNLSMSEATVELTKGDNTEYGLILKRAAYAPTNMENLKGMNNVQKLFFNDNIYIIRDAKVFNAQGVKVK